MVMNTVLTAMNSLWYHLTEILSPPNLDAQQQDPIEQLQPQGTSPLFNVHKPRKVNGDRVAAAIKIQKFWRRHKIIWLDNELFKTAKQYIDDPQKLNSSLRASFGKTTVYLPTDLHLVLKNSGSMVSRKRFMKMTQAKEICVNNGYTHVVIPSARVYKNFIIESRLPLLNNNGISDWEFIISQMCLYYKNQKKFTNAVKEFTGILCQSEFKDLIKYLKDSNGYYFQAPSGRYDNIPLYLENDQGRIGLVDLETFSPKILSNGTRNNCYKACRVAICIFPFHFGDILDVAVKFDPEIESDIKKLEEVLDNSIKQFKEFLCQNGIELSCS